MNGNRPVRRRETLPGEAGALAATIEQPAEPPARWALFCHGFGSRKEFKPLAKISAALARDGWGALRFDFAGHGASEGQFAHTSLESQQRDVRSVHRWMAQRAMTPSLLLGHSFGGATLLSLGAELPAAGIATIGAPSDTRHLAALLERRQPQLRHGDADVEIAGVPRRITSTLLQRLRQADLRGPVARLRQRLLLLQPEHDDTVVGSHAEQIADWSGQAEAVRVLRGADHLLSRREDVTEAIAAVRRWLATSLG